MSGATVLLMKAKLLVNLAIAYIRVSTDRKRQELGAEAQRQAIETYAAKHGLTVEAWFTDEVSGGSELTERPGLLQALQTVRESRSGALLVAKRDRFTRDSLETASVELELRRMGAQLIAADGLGNGEDASSRLLAGILDAVSAFERHTIRTRIKAALDVKRARGERTGGIPYGRQLAADGIHLEPNPTEAETVDRARALRALGMTLNAVSAQLATEGRLNRKGRPFALQGVQQLLAL